MEETNTYEIYYDDTNILIGITEQTATIEELNTNILELLEVQRAQYVSHLFIIGIGCAVAVCLLLYKFFKLFY